MQPSQYHPTLLSQIHGSIGNTTDIPPGFQTLLQQINESYLKADLTANLLNGQIKLRTDQLLASTSRAYSFLDSLHMGFIMCDLNAEVMVSNSAIRSILASKIVDEAGTQTNEPEWNIATIDSIFRPGLQLKDMILQSLKSNQPLEFKEVAVGEHVLHLFVAPMQNQVSEGHVEQIGAVILVEDITEQKLLDRSKDEFLSIASHELRTPLTAIRGNASMMKKYYGDKLPDPSMLEMIDDIHESSVRLIEIVNDFLDVSALEQGKMKMEPTSFALHEVVDEVVRELKNLCDSKGIALVADQTVSSAPSVTADKQRIKQVVYNLVGNAVKFTDQGLITISTKSDDSFVDTFVTDSGKGMSLESQQLLFRKFQQAGSSILTRDSTRGTGLGLYISKLIVELSGGHVWLAGSEVDKGSVFAFRLPRTKIT